MSDSGVLLFRTTSAALRADHLLREAGLRVRLGPAPGELSRDCSLAVYVAWDQAERARATLEAGAARAESLHRLDGDGRPRDGALPRGAGGVPPLDRAASGPSRCPMSVGLSPWP